MSFFRKILSLFSDHDERNDEIQNSDINFDDYSTDDDDDNYDEDDDEEETYISSDEGDRFLKALERFYLNLTEKEREDDDLDDAINDLQDQFFEGKIKNPEKALSDIYEQWKSSKTNRKIKKKHARSAIIDRLWHFDELTDEQKDEFFDSDSPFYLDKLNKNDEDEIDIIIMSWYNNKILDEDKFRVINYLSSCDIKPWDFAPNFEPIENVALTEENYKLWRLILKERFINWEFYCDYLKYDNFFMRYWKESRNGPNPIECEDMIVNRPCYLKLYLRQATPHFHMKKRYFDRDSLKDAIVYLFADSIEYISDEGHVNISLKDIIEVRLNDWREIHFIRERISEWIGREKQGHTNKKPCPEEPEPELLEITIRNGKKICFTAGRLNSNCKAGNRGIYLVDLMEMHALIYLFCKKCNNE